jgi:hypothetical protein
MNNFKALEKVEMNKIKLNLELDEPTISKIKLNFELDKPTINNRMYLKDDFIKALDKKLENDELFIMYDQQNTLENIMGKVISYKIENNIVEFEFQDLKRFIVDGISEFMYVTTVVLCGKIENNIVKDYIISHLFMIFEKEKDFINE